MGKRLTSKRRYTQSDCGRRQLIAATEHMGEMPKALRQHHRKLGAFAKRCREKKVSFLGI